MGFKGWSSGSGALRSFTLNARLKKINCFWGSKQMPVAALVFKTRAPKLDVAALKACLCAANLGKKNCQNAKQNLTRLVTF